MDGVNSMTGNAPDIREFARVARRYDAILYVDDAHGFGVIGERSDDELEPVRESREQRRAALRRVVRRDRSRVGLLEVLLLARGFHRLPDPAQGAAQDGSAAVPLLGAVADSLTRDRARGIRRQRGSRRADPLPTSGARRRRCSSASTSLGIHTPNRSGFPIVEVPLARHEDIDAAGRFLFENGIYVTLAAYPLVPKTEVGFRIQVTAANSQAEIEQLVDVIGKLAAAFDLRPAQSKRVRGMRSCSWADGASASGSPTSSSAPS